MKKCEWRQEGGKGKGRERTEEYCDIFRYSYHFPELIKIIPENALFAKCVKVRHHFILIVLICVDMDHLLINE